MVLDKGGGFWGVGGQNSLSPESVRFSLLLETKLGNWKK